MFSLGIYGRRAAAGVCALALALSCAGCSGKDKDTDKKANKPSPVAAANDTDSADESSQAQGHPGEDVATAADGEYIQRLYSFLTQDSYSIKLRFTDSQGRVTDITETVRGDDVFMSQVNDLGENGLIRVDGVSYDYDLLCGIYRKSSRTEPASLIKSIVEQDLPQTNTYIDKNLAQVYAAEEYTFTGDTYMTTVVLYFDKETGLPVRYVTTYMTEGHDEIVEIRDILELTPGSFFEPAEEVSDTDSSDSEGDSEAPEESAPQEIISQESEAEESQASEDSGDTDESEEPDESGETEDSGEAAEAPLKDDPYSPRDLELPVLLEELDESVFDLGFLEPLVDFDAMTEERRLGYCEAILVTAGIPQVELTYHGITEEQLRTISYDDFTALVYSLKEG